MPGFAARALPTLVAGDTYTVTLGIVALLYVGAGEVYPTADGWTFTATLAGPATASAEAVRVTGGVALTLAADVTAQLPPGTYRLTLAASRGAGETRERATLATWALAVAPDPTGGRDPRHPDERALELAYARREELLGDSMKQYGVGGAGGQRMVIRRDLDELTREIRRLEHRVATRARLAAGGALLGSIAFGFPTTAAPAASGGGIGSVGVTRLGGFG